MDEPYTTFTMAVSGMLVLAASLVCWVGIGIAVGVMIAKSLAKGES